MKNADKYVINKFQGTGNEGRGPKAGIWHSSFTFHFQFCIGTGYWIDKRQLEERVTFHHGPNGRINNLCLAKLQKLTLEEPPKY